MQGPLDIATTIAILLTCVLIVWTNLDRLWPPPPEAIPPPDVPVTLEGASFRGDSRAPVALVMYTDYECPYCARFERDTLPLLEREYVQTGRLRVVVRHYPLESIHPRAFEAAVAATCAGAEGKFWQLHELLFQHQGKLDPGVVEQLARQLNLDMSSFAECVSGDRAAAHVRADASGAVAYGLKSTPTFFVGRVQHDERVVVQAVLLGARPVGDFVRTIEESLSPESGKHLWKAGSAATVALLGAVFWLRRRLRRRTALTPPFEGK